jgi:hypothetical protein
MHLTDAGNVQVKAAFVGSEPTNNGSTNEFDQGRQLGNARGHTGAGAGFDTVWSEFVLEIAEVVQPGRQWLALACQTSIASAVYWSASVEWRRKRE